MPLPRRTLADWTPDAGTEDEWLARWGGQGGWVPEYGSGASARGTDVISALLTHG